jgi:hypothetical protein
MLTNLSSAQLRRAAALKEQLEALQNELAGLLGAPEAPVTASAPAKAPKKKVTISAAGIARIRAAQKARWAKIKAGAKPAAAPKKKFTMSAAAKAAISKAAKARWAKIKAAKGA